jgi:hypothetical protein
MIIPESNKWAPMIKVQPNQFILWNEYTGDRRHLDRMPSDINLQLSKIKPDVSKKAQRRILQAIDWFLLLSKPKQAENLHTRKLFTYRLAMATLTLPCEQIHDDRYIKHNMLAAVFNRLRKEHNVRNYIWKAEKQYNGSIHFHIILDQFIHYFELNRIWNVILKHHGYIEQYRQNMLEFHNDGFKVRKELLKQWPLEQQKAAYNKGMKENWQNPVSSTDIHSLKKIKKVRAYVAKYLTKNPDISKYKGIQLLTFKKKYNVKVVPDWKIEQINDDIKKKLHVDGNYWYISRELSKCKIKSQPLDDISYNEISTIHAKFKDKIIECDRCTVYCFNIFELAKFKFTGILNHIKKFVLTQREIFFPPGTDRNYLLGLPIPLFDV